MFEKDFKKAHSQEERKNVSERIRAKYPDRVPVIINKSPDSTLPICEKVKFIVPADITLGKFMYEIRKHIELAPECAIFLFINNILPPVTAEMSDIYSKYADEDGFLYIVYTGENTFGQ